MRPGEEGGREGAAALLNCAPDGVLRQESDTAREGYYGNMEDCGCGTGQTPVCIMNYL